MIETALGTRRGQRTLAPESIDIAVRVDRPGSILSDYHTAGGGHSRGHRKPDGSKKKPGEAVLSTRYYIEDAAFTIAISGAEQTISTIAEALKRPVWQLYLGRRSCPPSAPLLTGVTHNQPEDIFKSLPLLRQPTRQDIPLKITCSYSSSLSEGNILMDQPDGYRRFGPRLERIATIETSPELCVGIGPQAWAKRSQHLIKEAAA